MSETLLLLSGGVESATLLYTLRDAAPRALFLDYGQRAAARERAASEALCARVGAALVALDLAAVGERFRRDQSKKLHVPIPHRNLIALSLGLSYAEQCGARRLALGLNRDDRDAYASAGDDFIARFRALAQTLSPQVAVVTPLIAWDKAEVVRRGEALGVPWSLTYSCLLGYADPCGACPQCSKRRAAFAAAGVAEPGVRYGRGHA
ncbi:7-cyano-7-deazaguanine synthase [Ectothiorhodospiraceae bacterium 2226]|nr:7-cyano-7-deazaguanine synthase [Ectothiorhodospiraceae bacterium 2226]